MRIIYNALLIVFILLGSALAKTNISGTIAHDSTLRLTGSPYIVTGDVIINQGVTLTIDSSVCVLFNKNTNLNVGGILKARYATFTSAADTSDGTPKQGDWGSIMVGYTPGSATLDTCQVKYGGNSNNAIIYLYSGYLTLNNVQISSSNYNAVVVNSGNAKLNGIYISNCIYYSVSFYAETNINISNSTIQTGKWPIVYNGSANLTFNGINNFINNTYNGILMNFSSTSASFTLNKVSIPYEFLNDLTVSSPDISTGIIQQV